jgi:hypothetical protein
MKLGVRKTELKPDNRFEKRSSESQLKAFS